MSQQLDNKWNFCSSVCLVVAQVPVFVNGAASAMHGTVAQWPPQV